MEQVINPFVLYIGLVLGAVGVCVALPRRGLNPQVIGALVAAAGAGLVILGLITRAVGQGEGAPNIYFYIFGVIALGASLRVITHPRPVYAALYFILSILASAGLYVILAAHFMAFALIIIYAGAILITYLFVIMLATQAPTEDREEFLETYDLESREPIVATVAGFALLGVLTTMLFSGAGSLTPRAHGAGDVEVLGALRGRVNETLREAGVINESEHVIVEAGKAQFDLAANTALVIDESGAVRHVEWEPGLVEATNAERIGYNLVGAHPGAIEIAGVILLMAMLGAVVLARKRVDLDEAAKAAREPAEGAQ